MDEAALHRAAATPASPRSTPETAPPTSWRERWQAWRDRALDLRDRLLASPVFRRRAASFPLTRPIARRRARALFDLVAGFVYSQVLLACVRLGVFPMLAEGPQTIDRLAPRLGMAPDAARRLLDAAVALRLVERRGEGRYGLGPLGAPLVGDTAIAAMVLHHAALYDDLADPVALLRKNDVERRDNALARYWAYDRAGAEIADPEVAAYSALMAASQPLVADQILGAYPLGRHRSLLDVGGGDGTFLATVAARHPHLKLQLFDLPAVAERARVRFEAAGLDRQVTVAAGSFLADTLPAGADVVTLVRVLHDHDDAAAMQLLRAAHAALPAGGTLLIAEPMAGTPGAEAMGDAYFGFYLLAMGRGRPRTFAELGAMVEAAGFTGPRALRTDQPLQTGLLVARRHG